MSVRSSTPYRAPPVFDPARAARFAAELGLPAHGYLDRPDTRALILGAAGNSPYLAGLMLREPEYLAEFFTRGPDAILADLNTHALAAGSEEDQANAMRRVRVAKRPATLVYAIASPSTCLT